MSTTAGAVRSVLVTGGTGFVGHFLLRELLSAGVRCVALVRPGSSDRLRSLLDEIGAPRSPESLIILEGVLPDGLPECFPVGIEAVVHAAGVTRFDHDPSGEPFRTNVEGTRALLALMDRLGVRSLHYVGTAYSQGAGAGTAFETHDPHHATFRNAYEQSKHAAETLCLDWAKRASGSCTICRPSVVVGETGTGRCTSFLGFYMAARATELLSRSLDGKSVRERHAVPLRIQGQPDGRQNLVPVDYVARAVTHILRTPPLWGRIYHLTHPSPPSNQDIKRWLEAYFDLGGGRFVDPATWTGRDMSECEKTFYSLGERVRAYFQSTPVFGRSNTDAALAGSGIPCPVFDAAAIATLLDYAQATNWGRRRGTPSGRPSPCSRYFERFVSTHLPESKVAAMTALTTTLRFIIEDEPDGEWIYRFEKGRLISVQRGANGVREEYGYRSTREAFWDAISGLVPPQDLFLTSRAEVYGDVERALKMANILHEFTKEFPCDAKRLAAYGDDDERERSDGATDGGRQAGGQAEPRESGDEDRPAWETT